MKILYREITNACAQKAFTKMSKIIASHAKQTVKFVMIILFVPNVAANISNLKVFVLHVIVLKDSLWIGK